MMTPRKIVTGATDYGAPLLGPANHTATVQVDISTLTTAEVDAAGNLKPGVLLKVNGALCDGTANEYVYGCVMAPIPLGRTYAITTVALAADTGTVNIAVATMAQVQRDICEDNLGRAFNAYELAALLRAGCHLVVTRT